MSEAESRVSTNEVNIESLQKQTEEMEATIKALTLKVDDLEKTQVQSTPGIGRTDEGIRGSAQRNTRPRAVIMKFLNHSDKVRTMKAARDEGAILFEGRRVMFSRTSQQSCTGSEKGAAISQQSRPPIWHRPPGHLSRDIPEKA
ncbi:hypothetical protein SRHO_G00028890 [Serrasalmus rhombeus]